MSLSIYISEISFHNGLTVALDPGSVVVFVGPNNSGKSASLRAIRSYFESNNKSNPILSGIALKRSGNGGDVEDFIEPYRKNSSGYPEYKAGYVLGLSLVEAISEWESNPHVFQRTSDIYLNLLTAASRLSDCRPADNFDSLEGGGYSHPIQDLYFDDNLEVTVSNKFREAFGYDLVVHRSAGKSIPLYVGQRPIPLDGETQSSRSFYDRIAKLDTLELQGDGFRSFASLLLRTWTRAHPVLLIDEPEAFLHPPQARMVGELISTAPVKRQSFIATHSNDILQGLLAAYPEKVVVIRMQRDTIGASYLESREVAQLWKDPSLRYSNALSGLFHSSVVITEADADCKFYEAMSETSRLASARNDIFFTYGNGKQKLPQIVNALTRLNVEVATIVDIDVLNSSEPLRSLVVAHGGNWGSVQAKWKVVKLEIEKQTPVASGKNFKKEITDALSTLQDNQMVERDLLARLKNIMRTANAWDTVKDAGKRAIPKGDATRIANELFQELKEVGLFVVPNGEMEGFCKSVGGKGQTWVETVLQKDIFGDDELEDARKFMMEVKTYLGESIAVGLPSPNTKKVSQQRGSSQRSFLSKLLMR